MPLPKPFYVLGIETATDVCSVALRKDGMLVQETGLARPRAHSAELAPMIAQALSAEGIAPADLGLVAVSQGPGSYTGLRIGVSTAKGLAYALDVPLVGVSTLEALALAAAEQARPGSIVLPALDARRDELYAAAYRVPQKPEASLEPLLPEQNLTLTEAVSSLSALEGPAGLLVGHGAAKLHAKLPGDAQQTWTVLDPTQCPPTARTVARRGWSLFQAGHREDVAAFEPAYLKAFFAKKGASVFDRLPPMSPECP